MARRAAWDVDDDFEIVNEPLSSTKKTIQEKFEFIEDEFFDLAPCTIEPTPSINIINPIQPVTIIEQPVPVPIKIEEPIIDEVVKQSSVEKSSFLPIKIEESTIDEVVKQSSIEKSSFLPIRYGVAAMIPHDEGFDLKSVLNHKSSLPIQTNDLLNFLQNDKSKKTVIPNNNLQQILIDNDYNRHNLVQIAKQAQQDFINAMQLD